MKWIYFCLILLTCSCSKTYKMKNYLEGTWAIEKLQVTESNGFEYEKIPDGTLIFDKTSETSYLMKMNVLTVGENSTLIEKSVIFNFSDDYKSLNILINDQEQYGSIPLITKDELLVEFYDGERKYRMVGGK